MDKRSVLAGVISGMLLVAACGDDGGSGVSRDEFVEEATSGEGALTEEQANCVYDGIEEAGIDLDDFDLEEGPSTDQQDAFLEIVLGCADFGDLELGDLPEDVPDDLPQE